MTKPGPTPQRPYRAARAGRRLLTALVGLLLVLAAVVVGAVPAAAQNAVGASTTAAANTVGVSTDIGAGQRLGNTAPQPQIVVATAVAADTAASTARALSSAERTTLDDALQPDNFGHIFDPKHNFDPLIDQYGSKEAVLEQFVRNIGGPLPESGPYQVVREIGGQTVFIRGAVVNGVPRIGTAFTP